jgi:hypothetical protein
MYREDSSHEAAAPASFMSRSNKNSRSIQHSLKLCFIHYGYIAFAYFN